MVIGFAVTVDSSAASASGGGVRQIGVTNTDNASEHSLSAATEMTQPATNPYDIDGSTNFYWVGLNLADGSFIQSGYATNDVGCSGIEWFWEAFNPSGQVQDADRGNCGTISGTHTFSVNRRFAGYYGSSFTYGWNGETAGPGANGVIGNTYYNPFAPNSGTNRPGAVSELSNGSVLPSSSDEMAGVKFYPAVSYSFSGGGAPYTNAAHGVVYGLNRVCDPEEVFNDSVADEFRAGTVYSSGCWANGRTLW